MSKYYSNDADVSYFTTILPFSGLSFLYRMGHLITAAPYIFVFLVGCWFCRFALVLCLHVGYRGSHCGGGSELSSDGQVLRSRVGYWNRMNQQQQGVQTEQANKTPAALLSLGQNPVFPAGTPWSCLVAKDDRHSKIKEVRHRKQDTATKDTGISHSHSASLRHDGSYFIGLGFGCTRKERGIRPGNLLSKPQIICAYV
jgi:hypothetical protein